MDLSNGWVIYYSLMLGIVAALAYRFGYKTGKVESENEEMKKHTFEIEKHNGETYIAFEISVYENADIEITKTRNCSLADVDGDYIFDTDNKLYRIQSEVEE